MESKDLLDLCRQAGIDVKNQLSSLDPEQRDAVELLVRQGGQGGVAVAPPPPKAVVSVLPTLTKEVPVLPTRTPRRETDGARTSPPAAPAHAPAVGDSAKLGLPPAAKSPDGPRARPAEPGVAKAPEAPAARAPEPSGPASEAPPKAPGMGAGKVRDLGQARPEGAPRPRRTRDIPRPVVARVAQPPPLKQPPPKKEEEKKPEPAAQKPIARLPEGLRGGAVNQDLINKLVPGEIPVPPIEDEDEGEADKKGKARPGGVAGRDKRHQQRQDRARLGKDRLESDVRGGRPLV